MINGRVGVEAGGRVRFRDSLQEGDRSEIRLRGAGAVDSYLNMPGSRLVLSHLLGEGRWFGRSWTGGDNGLRPAVEFKSELWGLQREDLQLEHYNLGSIEGAAGVGALLDPRFGFALTAGLQRRWLFALQNLRDPAYTQITDVPAVENRAFARLLGQFTFNPGDLRRDQRSLIEFELAGFTPYKSGGSPFLRAALHGRKIWTFNWHELWLTGRATGLAGDVQFVDQEPVADHLRLGFGGTVYVNGITSGRVEFRFSILRDLFKVSLFNDLGTFRQANPADQSDRAVIGGSSGAGLHVLVVDHFQLDGYVGTGWTNTGYQRPGFLLNIKDAF
ncbi:MAG: hypothetical protein JST92_22935 [Deltaproteobacteria bacterium]|nr:hypothetical protein [Deltaproteobacteria bacterium]